MEILGDINGTVGRKDEETEETIGNHGKTIGNNNVQKVLSIAYWII